MERFHWVPGAPQYWSDAFLVTDLDTRWRCDNSSVLYPQAAFGGIGATEARSNPLRSSKENGLLLQSFTHKQPRLWTKSKASMHT